MDIKYCKDCVDFKKLKSFDELSVVFHNYCSYSDLPCALLGGCQKFKSFTDSINFQNKIEEKPNPLDNLNPMRSYHY